MRFKILAAVAAVASLAASAVDAASLIVRGVATSGVHTGQNVLWSMWFDRSDYFQSPYELGPGIDNEVMVQGFYGTLQIGDAPLIYLSRSGQDFFISWGPSKLIFDYEGDDNLEVHLGPDVPVYGPKSFDAAVSGTGTYGRSDSGFKFSVTHVTIVPEPATWALMIGGFGLAGASLRRRRVAAI